MRILIPPRVRPLRLLLLIALARAAAAEVVIGGDAATGGWFDPVVAQGADGTWWMSYTAVDTAVTGFGALRVARSTDQGATWTRQTEAIAGIAATVAVNGVATAGTWMHEVSSLALDATEPDPSRRWKMLGFRYFKHGTTVEAVTHGGIVLFTAPAASGPWSAPSWLFGTGLLSPAAGDAPVDVDDASGQSAVVAVTEPSLCVHDGALWAAFTAIVPDAITTVTYRIVLYRSTDHGATWSFRGVALTPADAAAVPGAEDWDAACLVSRGGTLHLAIAPIVRTAGGNSQAGVRHLGVRVFTFADPAAAQLVRSGGLPVAVAALDAAIGGFLGAPAVRPDGTVLASDFLAGRSPRSWMIIATGTTVGPSTPGGGDPAPGGGGSGAPVPQVGEGGGGGCGGGSGGAVLVASGLLLLFRRRPL